MSDSSDNRRQGRRVSAPFVDIRVRKRGLGINRWTDECSLADLSSSGLSFFSAALRLETLDKVDLELTVEGRQVSGSAIVCHSSFHHGQRKYGLLFIQADAELENLLSGQVFSTGEVRHLGEELAEQFMRERSANNENSARWLRANQLMLDAVRAMVSRLGDLGLLIYDEHGQEVRPADALAASDDGGVSFPCPGIEGGKTLRVSVAAAWNTDTGADGYILSTGQSFASLLELLDFICSCFGRLASAPNKTLAR